MQQSDAGGQHLDSRVHASEVSGHCREREHTDGSSGESCDRNQQPRTMQHSRCGTITLSRTGTVWLCSAMQAFVSEGVMMRRHNGGGQG